MSSDWLGRSRVEQLQTARNWIKIFNEDTTDKDGKASRKYQAWGIPEEVIAELGAQYAAAQEALSLAQNAETRTPVVNQRVKTNFETLEALLRMIKRRFGHIPPLSEADFVAMGWKVSLGHAAAAGVSETVPTGLVNYPVPHVVRLRIVPLDETLFDRKTAALVCVRWGILDPAKEGRVYIKKAPVSADDLPEQEDRRRRDEDFILKAEDAGKKIYFCMRYVNTKSESGMWGPLIEAVIT